MSQRFAMKKEIKKRNKKVYIFARKILKNNTRIFKQANSLVKAGYKVKIIGILAEGLQPYEEKDGYEIFRVRMNPLHKSILNNFKYSIILLREGLSRLTKVLGKPGEFMNSWIRRKIDRSQNQDKIYKKRADSLFFRTTGKDVYTLFRFHKSTLNNFKYPIILWRERLKRMTKIYKKRTDNFFLRITVTYVYSLIRITGKYIYGLARLTTMYVYRLLKITIISISNLSYQLLRRSLPLGKWLFFSIEYYIQSYKVTRKDFNPPDIVHANDLDTLFIAWWVAFRTHAKLIYDAQELYTEMHTLPIWYRKILLPLQEFFLIHRADKIIAVNEFIAKEMSRKYRVKIDEIVLNCPPYEGNLLKEGVTIKEKFNIDPHTPVYLYSGGLVKQRGIENTILALKYLKEGVLVVLGEGPLKDKLLELIKRENLESRVFFSKFIPHTEVPKFIRLADVGIIPYENVGINHYLCSPSKLFHYIMAELPVACSDFPFLRKVVIDNGLGATFDPGDPRSIAESIEFIISSKTRYSEIKRNLAQAKKRYCWENEERKFLKIYRGLDS